MRCPCHQQPRRWLLRAGIALLVGVLSPAARAQELRQSRTSFSAVRRFGDNAAEEQGCADWPRVVDGRPGTQVHLTFDIKNADVVLITGLEVGLDTLVEEARRLAGAINRPRADYLMFAARKTVAVDVELNRYLEHPARGRTEFELALSPLAKALQASRLPRPIMLCVHADQADEALLVAASSAPRRLGEATFLNVDQVTPGTRLRFAAMMPWHAPLAAAGLGGLLLLAFVFTAVAPWRIARGRERLRLEGVQEPDPTPDPAEVQKRYNRQPPLWMVTAFLPLLILTISLFGNPARAVSYAIYLLPDPAVLMFLPLGLVGTVAVSHLLCALYYRARSRGMSPAPAAEADPDAPPAWTQHWVLTAMLGMMVPLTLVPILLFSGLPRPPWMPHLLLALMVLMPGILGMGGWLAARATRRTLAPGDPWHDLAQEVAGAGKVRIRAVVRIQSRTLNASASLFGTIGLTSALLRQLEPEEVRAVVAHEIGHVRGGHARRNLLVGLAACAVLITCWWTVTEWARGHVPRFTLALLRGPLVGVFLLPLILNLVLGHGRRGREQEADRFAVDYTGDAELVIQTLTKLHILNATPHELKPSDEAISTHPSLARRIAAIREYAAALNG
jgi:Zn-dependent protease with chaperone function